MIARSNKFHVITLGLFFLLLVSSSPPIVEGIENTEVVLPVERTYYFNVQVPIDFNSRNNLNYDLWISADTEQNALIIANDLSISLFNVRLIPLINDGLDDSLDGGLDGGFIDSDFGRIEINDFMPITRLMEVLEND